MKMLWGGAVLGLIFSFFAPSAFAEWRSLENGYLPKARFAAGKLGKAKTYFCRDSMGNLGTAMAGKGCQLVYGEQKPTLDYQVLTNPGLDLNWLPAHSKKNPPGAFDGGITPLLKQKILCQKSRGGRQYIGYLLNKKCHYRIKGSVAKTSKYKVLVRHWISQPASLSNQRSHGKRQSESTFICRVQIEGIFIPGTLNALTNRCEVADKMGVVHNLEGYDVQLGIPHRWQKSSGKGLPKKTIPTGADCTYFICRAKVLNNVLLGKTTKKADLCEVVMPTGVLQWPDFQIQVKAQ